MWIHLLPLELIDGAGGGLSVETAALDGASTFVKWRDRRVLHKVRLGASVMADVTCRMVVEPFVKAIGKTDVDADIASAVSAKLIITPFGRAFGLAKCAQSVSLEARAVGTSFDRDLQDFMLILETL